MWQLKMKIKHDCTIGNRCEQFSCESYSTPLTQWSEDGYEYVLGEHILVGESRDIERFVRDLKKDSRVVKLEREGNTLFLLERERVRIPARVYHKKIFFVRPVFVDKKGFECWEIASFDKKTLMNYIHDLEKEKSLKCTVEKIVKSVVKDVFYARVMPRVTERQKRAFELAVENGYYHFPRKVDLAQLAKLMKVSISTYQEHLRKAEEKLMPSMK